LTRFRFACVLVLSGITLVSSDALAQTPSPSGGVPSLTGVVNQQQGPAQGAQNAVQGTVKRFNIGVQGGVAVHPVLIVAGAYAELGPVLSEKVTIRPDFYVAGGEVTTELGFDVDGLFPLPWSVGAGDSWRTYAGIGASFALSHESFQAPVNDSTTTTTASDGTTTTTQDRFDFSDTDFEVGANFIFGMRNPRGVFFEARATAFGVANVKLLAGFKF